MAVAAEFDISYGMARNIIVKRFGPIRKPPIDDVPEILPPIPPQLLAFKRPTTAAEFHLKRQIQDALKSPKVRRAEAGADPLPPFHPIAAAALPRLLSLGKK